MKSAVYVGIDVSREYVDVAVSGKSSVVRVVADDAALESLGRRLLELEPELVLMEPDSVRKPRSSFEHLSCAVGN